MDDGSSLSSHPWLPFAVGAATIIAIVVASVYLSGIKPALKLPGKLQASGQFALALPDLQDESTALERQRDFERICRAQKDLRFAVLRDGKIAGGGLKLLEVEDASSFRKCMDGVAACVGGTQADAFEKSGAYSFVSASSPFDFSMQLGIVPMFGEPQYVLLYHEDRKTFQVLWGAWINDKAEPMAPGKKWPFFVWYLSEEVLGDSLGDKVRFTYGAAPNRHSSVVRCVESVLQEQFA
eukprot:g15937.t1